MNNTSIICILQNNKSELCYNIKTTPQKDAIMEIFSHISMPDISKEETLLDAEKKIIKQAINTIYPNLVTEELDALTEYILNIPIIKFKLEDVNERFITRAQELGKTVLGDVVGLVPIYGDAIGFVIDVGYSSLKYKKLYDRISNIKTEIIDIIPHTKSELKKLLKNQIMKSTEQAVNNVQTSANNAINNSINSAQTTANNAINNSINSAQTSANNAINNSINSAQTSANNAINTRLNSALTKSKKISRLNSALTKPKKLSRRKHGGNFKKKTRSTRKKTRSTRKKIN